MAPAHLREESADDYFIRDEEINVPSTSNQINFELLTEKFRNTNYNLGISNTTESEKSKRGLLVLDRAIDYQKIMEELNNFV